MLFHTRRQLAVGQGCFHAGQLGDLDGEPVEAIRYVYDCGAMKKYETRLNAEVDGYHAYTNKAPLDFLFISHLHADHVAGVERLATPIHVDTIVMPLVNVVDRLFVFAQTAAEDADAADDEFFRSLIADPVSAVARFNPRQVVLVTRGEGPAATGGPDARPEAPGPAAGDGPTDQSEGRRRWRWKLAGRGDVVRTATGVADPRPGQSARAEAVYTMPDTRGFEIAGGATTTWILAPYVDPQVEADRQKFIDALAASMKSTTAKVEELLSADREGLLLLLTQCKGLLADAYKAVADLNATSLCLYSGPADDQWPPSAWDSVLGEDNSGFIVWGGFSPSARLGWIGSGDAELGDTAAGLSPRRDAFLTHYAAHFPKVATFLVPHHGSAKNFHEELLDQIMPSVCLASAAPFSNWRHPGTEVLQAACARGIPLWVTNHAPPSRVLELVRTAPGEDEPDVTFLGGV